YLGLLALSGAAAWYSIGRLPLALVVLIFYVHGTFYAFLVNAFHEFCHQTVFKSKWLNPPFLYLISFMSWSNPVWFWASHQEHHKYTLHPPDDQEVILPQKITLESFLKTAIANPWDMWFRIKMHIRLARGIIQGSWEERLFPPSAVALRRDLFNWARFALIGHLVIAAVALALGWWPLILVFTLAPFYGGLLQWLCNNTQHAGLQDNVSDFRLCTRTFTVNPFVQFLYWHMNYHIDHHMYAAVPCYNLPKLHRAIRADLPHCPAGLIATWREIIPIIRRQRLDPTYEFVAELPN
ncbi:MAG TPA: fatty acid desaturase, partial [Gemmatimonadales bacterium]